MLITDRPASALAGDQVPETLRDLFVADPLETVGGDRGHRRVDPAHDVGPAGGRVLVGRFVQALHRKLDRPRRASMAVPPAELDRGAGVAAAGAGGVEVGFLVATAGDVVGEDATGAPAQVVAGEDRHHGEALHGHRQVAADHLAQLVGLALEAERVPFDFS